MLAFLLVACFSQAIAAASSSSQSACSDPTPIALPVTNVELSNGQSMRGVPLSIGNPPQNFSFMPHDFFNDTWVYNTSEPFCFDNSTRNQCMTQRGGFYDPTKSSSAQGGLNVYQAGGDPSDTTGRTDGPHIWFSKWAKDTLNIGNTSLHDFPIGMAGLDFGGRLDTQANIGLGQNSTFLQALKDAGRISSRTWSFWPGIDSATSSAAKDGQIIFGGYDAAKVTGPNITQRLVAPSKGCPSGMSMIVTSMRLDFPNGTQADLVSPGTFSACFQPDFPMVITAAYNPYYGRFINDTLTEPFNNSLGIHWFAPVYDPRETYAGDFTIGFDTGFTVTIPNEVLVVPDQYVSPSGALEANSSASAVLFGGLSDVNANDNPIIGKQFFSSAYLMVDLDAGTYTLWNVNATEETNLVAVGGSCSQHPTVSDHITNDTSSSTTIAAAANTATSTKAPNGPSTPDNTNSTISTGTIVGAVIGSAFGTGALVAAAVFFVFRRRRNSVGTTGSTTELTARNEWKSDSSSTGTASYQWYPVNALGLYGPTEMSAAQLQPHELGGYQKPQELRSAKTPKFELDAS